METTWIFPPSKLHQKKYVEITWIFRSAKLRRRKYVETTWIFRPSKLHRKSTYAEMTCGNSSKFSLWRIDVISTSIRRGFDVVCIGYRLFNFFQFSFFLVKMVNHYEFHVICQDIKHQLQENILLHFLPYSFYEIFIKLRSISYPLKIIYWKILQNCLVI